MRFQVLSCILIAAVGMLCYSFRTVPLKLSGTAFELIDISQPFDPNSYQQIFENPIVACPGEGFICKIVIPLTDIYASGTYVGKPKVDIQTPTLNELSDQLTTVMNTIGTPSTFGNRTIYETNEF
ncbi:hypothetical protein [Chitinophaga barathri]|uniref:Uncharacterized protein n=1 Tax=Chitinophaga barathri TaxID=1647451 RepID=A0A3N4M7Q6_9BACT|nr:hypothetical protein [Chitinophaga barathri]RPD39328.1 hypothetical protein EG028_19570 [Chitinophaga barathri]